MTKILVLPAANCNDFLSSPPPPFRTFSKNLSICGGRGLPKKKTTRKSKRKGKHKQSDWNLGNYGYSLLELHNFHQSYLPCFPLLWYMCSVFLTYIWDVSCLVWHVCCNVCSGCMMTSTRDSFIARDVGYAGLCDFSQFTVAIVVISNFNMHCERNLLKVAIVWLVDKISC